MLTRDRIWSILLNLFHIQLYNKNLYFKMLQRHPTPVLLPGKPHGWRSLVGCSPWGRWVRHDWATSLSLFTFMHWRRKWQPTPLFLPGESQGREPGGLPSMGLHRVGNDWRDLAAAGPIQCLAIVKWKKVKLLSRVPLFATPWTIQSMEFPRP